MIFSGGRRPFPGEFMGELFKKQTVAMPLHLPADWNEFFLSLGRDLGTSRNSVLCMCIKLGGPILRAHVDKLKADLRATCGRVAGGEVSISQFLQSEQPAPVVVKVVHGNQASRNRNQTGNKNGKRAGNPARKPAGRR